MFDCKKHFERYCEDHDLRLNLSFDMPEGFETANGTFDFETKTVFINACQLEEAPEYEQAFFLFHELRHASQYLTPERFREAVTRSVRYVIQYDGTCYKLVDGTYRECRLADGGTPFAELYQSQPHEIDANRFAYQQVKTLYGDSAGLSRLYAFWTPRQPVPAAVYDSVFAEIDEKTRSGYGEAE